MEFNKFLFYIIIVSFLLIFVLFTYETNSQIRDMFMLIFAYVGFSVLLIKEDEK